MLAAAIRNVVGTATCGPARSSSMCRRWWKTATLWPMTVSVASPMTSEDYVKSIHVLTRRIRQPNIGNFYLGPRAGRAQVSTRHSPGRQPEDRGHRASADGSFLVGQASTWW